MKRRTRKLFLSTTTLLSMFAVVGCTNMDDSSTNEKNLPEIESVSLTGLNKTYSVKDSIDFSKVKLTINYKSTTKKPDQLDKGEIDIEVSNAKEDSQFVLHTNGLSSQSAGALTKGEYSISCDILKPNRYSTQFTLQTIKVVDTYKELYDLEGFQLPSSLVERNRVLEEAGKSKTDYDDLSDEEASKREESSLKVKDESYEIGNDNEFIFKPEAQLVRKGTTKFEEANLPLKVTVSEIKDGNETAVGSDIYTFNKDTSGFKFTDAAINKQYKITAFPSEFEETDKASKISFTVKVEDGYNVYTALDLGRLNLLTDAHKTEVSNKQNTVYDGQCQAYFEDYLQTWIYDSVTKQTKSVETYKIWEDFLKSKNENI